MISNKKTVRILFLFTSTGLALWLVLEHRDLVGLEQENATLRTRLAQLDQARAENQRLIANAGQTSAPRAQVGQSEGLVPAEGSEQKQELRRLRSEVEGLHQQGEELEAVQADTRHVHAAVQTALASRNSTVGGTGAGSAAGNQSQFEVLSADYGTEKTNMDVAAELRERIRGVSLKAIASNNLKGDPDFGTVKHLTVVYRFGDQTFTNQFREGDYVVLPKEAN